jgi:hypothetical protein
VREGALAPGAMDGLAGSVGRNQGEQVTGCQRGPGDEVAPKKGVGATAAGIAVAVGAKKRSLRTSRSCPEGA